MRGVMNPLIRVLIVDDEEPARRKLARLLADHPEVQVVGQAVSGTSAVDAIRTLTPDLVFLDIQMPEGTGFDVISAIGVEAMPCVVFVTAFDEFAVRAFEVQALDYLLKPFTPQRLHDALARAIARISNPNPTSSYASLTEVLSTMVSPAPLRHLLVDHGPRSLFLAVDRIDWIEADRNYVSVHAAGHTCTVRSTLQALEARLDASAFLRINRSQLVRLNAVREIHAWSHGDRHLVMTDGTRLVWSRRYRARDEHRFTIE
jgi:two-component system LytT family response regulator